MVVSVGVFSGGQEGEQDCRNHQRWSRDRLSRRRDRRRSDCVQGQGQGLSLRRGLRIYYCCQCHRRGQFFHGRGGGQTRGVGGSGPPPPPPPKPLFNPPPPPPCLTHPPCPQSVLLQGPPSPFAEGDPPPTYLLILWLGETVANYHCPPPSFLASSLLDTLLSLSLYIIYQDMYLSNLEKHEDDLGGRDLDRGE